MTSAYTFFIDRALGPSVGRALQEVGRSVEFHDAHFSSDSQDVEWLPVVSQRDWIVLTKDNQIRYNLLETLAIANNQARVFILSGQSLTTTMMVSVFVDSILKIEKFIQGNSRPFIAKICKPSRIITLKDHRVLEKLARYHQI